MKGKSDEEILNERELAIKKAEELVGEPVEVINSSPVYGIPLWFLRKSLELFSTADVV